MERLSDWEPRLVAYIASALSLPHAYGSHDCLLHCAAAVNALTGKDLARGHRGKYRSAASAAVYLKSLGFDSPAAMIDSLLPEKSVSMAGRGDIVLDSDGIPGVVIGGDALMVGMGEGAEGLVRVPRSDWAKAWAV